MREINFRGLGVDNHWWFGGSKPLGEYRHCNLATFFPNVYAGSIRPETVGEWTGLHDKNGKEIYEGDIVTTGIFQDFNGKQEECRFAVEWKGKYGMWGLANRNAITTFILSEVSMWEVIGNIYENPELLAHSQKA